MKLFTRLLSLVVIAALAVAVFAVGYKEIQKKLHPLGYEELIEKYSAEYDLDKRLVLAVIKCESGFDSTAVSSVGARGLTQITEDTFNWLKTKMDEDAKELTFDDMFEPEVAIRFGCRLLSILTNEFKNYEASLAAYHAGSSRVRGWLEDPELSRDGVTLDSIPFEDTAGYVKKVMKAYETYGELYSDEL